MRKSRFTEAHIVGVLQEREAGARVSELCQRPALRTPRSSWKRKHGGPQVSEAKRLKALEKENRQQRRIVAD